MKKILLLALCGAALCGTAALASAAERLSVNPVTKKDIGARFAPETVIAVGTYDAAGHPDVALIDRWGVVSSKPAYIGIAVSKKHVTHTNIDAAGAFTVNFPSRDFLAAVDYAGNHSLVEYPSLDKFKATGLTVTKAETVNAPMIPEFPATLECKVIQSFDGGSHTFYIARVTKVWMDRDAFDTQGNLIPEKLDFFLYWPTMSQYYEVGKSLGTPDKIWPEKFPAPKE